MKAKKIIITAAFALLMLGLKAQDKYEYATVVYGGSLYDKKSFINTFSGDKNTETQIEIPKGAYHDLTQIMLYLNKMGNEGWEVYAVTPPSAGSPMTGIFYSLRRKK